MDTHSTNSDELGATPPSESPQMDLAHTVHGSARPKFIVSEGETLWQKPLVDPPSQNAPQQRSCGSSEPEVFSSAQLQEDGLETETSGGPNPDRLDSDLPGRPEDSWRSEVSARLNRYRARRRPRAPRYPSLRLKFDPPPSRTPNPPIASANSAVPTMTASPQATCQALAMNPVEEETPSPAETGDQTAPVAVEPPRSLQASAKILEFPRWSYAPPMPLNDLADPIVDLPRILEVPEVVTPPPAMGGITIEDARPLEPERRPGIDMPLRTAPLGLRIWAMVVDWIVVLSASALFAYISYRVSATRPPLWELIGLGAGLPCILWAAYQFLFLVYCGTTIGLRAAHLSISRFDGSPVNRRRRRLRVLCSLLSGLSLGMGYAWQFLDEDQLCWHERVTRTYLAPSA